MDDRPGAVAEKLAALAATGAKLGFIIARRMPEQRGSGVLLVTPLKAPNRSGRRRSRASSERKVFTLSALKVQTKPGLGPK